MIEFTGCRQICRPLIRNGAAMNLEEYSKYDALGLAGLVGNGDITAEELTDLAVEAVEKVNGDLNAIVGMLDQPKTSTPAGDARFIGVPTFLKDLGASIEGMPQEMGSRFTAGFVAPVTTNFSRQVLEAGFNVIGRTTCPEFGLTLTTETLAHGKTCNPWNTGKTTGGSSGGSAAIVAAGVVPLAHTNDGGGSTRIPASICGNVGLKTSRGRISLGPGMNDVTGPMIAEGCNSRTVRDTAAFLDAVTHPQPGEIYMERAGAFLDNLINNKPGSYRIAVSMDGWGDGVEMDAGVRAEVERVAQLLRDQGHIVEEATPEILKTNLLIDQFRTLWFVMAQGVVAGLAPITNRVPGPETLEPLTLKMVEAAEKVSGLDYSFAIQSTNMIGQGLNQFFGSWDLLLTPTLNKPTPDLGGNLRLHADIDLDTWYSEALSTVPHTPLANFTGIPAISVPVATGPEDMPLGMQFFGALGNEAALLDIARQLEEADPWLERRPSVHVSN